MDLENSACLNHVCYCRWAHIFPVMLRWMGKSCPSPAMRRLWSPFMLPGTPLWCRSSGGPPVAAPTAPLRKSMWWMCALRLTSPLNTSWRWQSSDLRPLLCLTSVPFCSQTGTWEEMYVVINKMLREFHFNTNKLFIVVGNRKYNCKQVSDVPSFLRYSFNFLFSSLLHEAVCCCVLVSTLAATDGN